MNSPFLDSQGLRKRPAASAGGGVVGTPGKMRCRSLRQSKRRACLLRLVLRGQRRDSFRCRNLCRNSRTQPPARQFKTTLATRLAAAAASRRNVAERSGPDSSRCPYATRAALASVPRNADPLLLNGLRPIIRATALRPKPCPIATEATGARCEHENPSPQPSIASAASLENRTVRHGSAGFWWFCLPPFPGSGTAALVAVPEAAQ